MNDLAEAVERGIRVQAVALALGAGLVALTGAAVLGQLLVRQSHTDTADRQVLAALGMSGRGRFAVAMLPASFVAVLAGGIAALVALAASPLMPFGLAREIEPDGGLWVDATVIVAGFLVTVAFVMSVMAVMAWRLFRETSASKGATGRRPVAVVERAGAGRLSADGSCRGFEWRSNVTLDGGLCQWERAWERWRWRSSPSSVPSRSVPGSPICSPHRGSRASTGMCSWVTRRVQDLEGESGRNERSRIEAVLADHPDGVGVRSRNGV